MSRAWRNVSSHRWEKVRRYVLQRDHHECQIRYPGCAEHATQVDHIHTLADGGDPYDPNNCRAACAPCNQRRNRRRPAPPAPISGW